MIGYRLVFKDVLQGLHTKSSASIINGDAVPDNLYELWEIRTVYAFSSNATAGIQTVGIVMPKQKSTLLQFYYEASAKYLHWRGSVFMKPSQYLQYQANSGDLILEYSGVKWIQVEEVAEELPGWWKQLKGRT